MRKFRFIGDPDKENYKGLVNGKEYYKHDSLPSVVGTPIYNDDFIEYYIEAYPKDWQEVFDPVEPVKGAQFTDIPKVAKHLHKDTDLGYFAGLIAQGLASNSLIDQNKTDIQSIAVLRAEELIRQLDEKAK